MHDLDFELSLTGLEQWAYALRRDTPNAARRGDSDDAGVASRASQAPSTSLTVTWPGLLLGRADD
jgi:hypothetical protein